MVFALVLLIAMTGGSETTEEAAELQRRLDEALSEQSLDEKQQRLLDSTVSRPDCPAPGPRQPADVRDDEVELEIMRVNPDGCLVVSYERVEVGEAAARIAFLHTEPDVIAASPLLLVAEPDEESTQWGRTRIGAPVPGSSEWPSGAGATVAVVDTGVDGSHPDLAGKVIGRLTFPGDPGGDLDNGNNHGTHVSGIIAAEGGNDVGIAGLAPGVSLLDAPAIVAVSGAPTPQGAIVWAADQGADVINMSFGMRVNSPRSIWDRIFGVGQAGSLTESLEVALYYAAEHGVVLVSSGGNCGNPRGLSKNCQGEVNPTTMPAAHPEVIATAATTDTASNDRAAFSTQREYIDIAAPGQEIVSLRSGGGTRSLSGTSQAAPHVAAVAAMILADGGPLDGQDRSVGRRDQVRSLLLDTAIDIGPAGADESFGAGLVNPNEFLSSNTVEPLPSGFTAVQAVVDVSGSMGDPADSSGQSKMAAAQLALGGILSALSAESGGAGGGTPTQAGLVAFDSLARVVVPITSDVNQLRSGVSGLFPGEMTNIGAGLTEGLNQIEAAGQGGTLILLSDGLITEGMESSEILSQLVPRAQALGVKIFTIGFGEAENLDESLLRQLADQTGGSYGQAETIVGIQGLFLQARHQSQGTVLASVTSAVGLGQTTTASAFTIPEGAAELHTALAWPGSDLDMTLIDPKGKPVDADYEGARFVTDEVTEVVVIDAPEPGEWRMDVTGVEMSGSTEDFFAIASTRGQVALVPPGLAIWPFVVGGGSLTLLAGGGATAALMASRRRNGLRRAAVPTLSVSVAAGLSTGLTLQIHPGDVLGRGTDADVRLPDDSVSRRHCQFIVVEEAFAVVDLDSSSGTFRNGEAIQRARLSIGDVLDLGEARLIILDSSDV